MVDAESELDQGIFGAGTDNAFVRPRAQCYVDGTYNDRFTRAGFTSENSESVIKSDIDISGFGVTT